jgi:hypothetical protein
MAVAETLYLASMALARLGTVGGTKLYPSGRQLHKLYPSGRQAQLNYGQF